MSTVEQSSADKESVSKQLRDHETRCCVDAHLRSYATWFGFANVAGFAVAVYWIATALPQQAANLATSQLTSQVSFSQKLVETLSTQTLDKLKEAQQRLQSATDETKSLHEQAEKLQTRITEETKALGFVKDQEAIKQLNIVLEEFANNKDFAKQLTDAATLLKVQREQGDKLAALDSKLDTQGTELSDVKKKVAPIKLIAIGSGKDKIRVTDLSIGVDETIEITGTSIQQKNQDGSVRDRIWPK